MGLCERFAILAVLSEEKAKVLKGLDEGSRLKTDAGTSDRLLKWPEIAKLSATNLTGDN
jgi:hypothetical protein